MKMATNLGRWTLICILLVGPGAHTDAREPTSSQAGTSGSLPTLVFLRPGTRVESAQQLPNGWSHLVIKSIPRLASGDLGTLPAVAKSTATMFRTTMLADVRSVSANGAPYVLRRVGLGLCTPVRGVDTVISSVTLNEQRISLGLVGSRVLERAEQELARGRIKARTPTFALFSGPTVMKAGATHAPMVLRYALLVDPQTGDLHTLLWPQALQPQDRAAPQRIALLPPGLLHDGTMDVAASRVLATVPVNWSFALSELPPGRVLRTTPELRRWTLPDTLSPAEAAALETELRRLLTLNVAKR